MRLGDHAGLAGFVLGGDISAQAWITTLLQEELPAQAYGRLLLLPGAKAPVAVQSRGKLVCSCFNLSDAAIDQMLAGINSGASALLASEKDILSALQAALQCGTNCGSCVPELQRRVRASSAAATALQRGQRAVIPIRSIP